MFPFSPSFTPSELQRLTTPPSAPLSHPVLLETQEGEQIPWASKEQLECFFHFTYSPTLFFSCEGQLKELSRLSPWLLRLPFIGYEKWDPSPPLPYQLAIRWVSSQVGYGLFAGESLPMGLELGEYGGEVRFPLSASLTHPYLFHYPTCWHASFQGAIDGKDHGSLMRFINHSDTPNLLLNWKGERSILHLTFQTKRKIEKGEQLLFHYGREFWRNRKKSPLTP